MCLSESQVGSESRYNRFVLRNRTSYSDAQQRRNISLDLRSSHPVISPIESVMARASARRVVESSPKRQS